MHGIANEDWASLSSPTRRPWGQTFTLDRNIDKNTEQDW